MNSLTWMIYAAGVLSNIQGVIVVFCIIFGVIWTISFSIKVCEDADFKLPIWPAAAVVVFSFLAALLPSERTIYLMAASEIGEKVVTDKRSAAVIDDLRTIIEQKIKDLKK